MNRFFILGQVVLLFFGFLWCREVLGRFRDDLEVMKTSRDGGHKAVILFWWGTTAILMLVMALFVVGLIARLVPIFSGGWG